MSFADKELLQVRKQVHFFSFFFGLLEVNLLSISVFVGIRCWQLELRLKLCEVLSLLFSPAAPGYENLRGHRLRHTAGAAAPQRHH